MQAYAEPHGGAGHRPQELLAYLPVPSEFKRHAHRTAGIVLVGRWHPKEDEQTIAYGGMQPSPIRVHHIVREIVQLLHRVVQGIEIETPTA
jgi:hypothetical protein